MYKNYTLSLEQPAGAKKEGYCIIRSGNSQRVARLPTPFTGQEPLTPFTGQEPLTPLARQGSLTPLTRQGVWLPQAMKNRLSPVIASEARVPSGAWGKHSPGR